MSLQQSQSSFALDVSKLITYIFSQGYFCTLGEAYRTQEQAALYAKEDKGIVNSLHCKRLALDLNIFDHQGVYLSETESYTPFGRYWESLDKKNRWGGHFSRADGNHFERNE